MTEFAQRWGPDSTGKRNCTIGECMGIPITKMIWFGSTRKLFLVEREKAALSVDRLISHSQEALLLSLPPSKPTAAKTACRCYRLKPCPKTMQLDDLKRKPDSRHRPTINSSPPAPGTHLQEVDDDDAEQQQTNCYPRRVRRELHRLIPYVPHRT